MISPLQLFMAFCLDTLIGDPRWLPHPVRIIGRGISGAERLLRSAFSVQRSASEKTLRWAGVALVLLIIVPAYLVTFFFLAVIFRLPGAAGTIAGTAAVIYLTATTLACRELIISVKSVITTVEEGEIEKARHNLGMIVGRDTRNLSGQDILKAAMETLAENLSDGVIAPLFYLVIGGVPLAVTYKAINTLDSMVGHKNDTYRYFGWAAARLDDIANYLPARLTGILIVVAAAVQSFASTRNSYAVMRRDGRKHLSPNSGIPEAAMAGALGVRMGGPAVYDGCVVDKPYIGNATSDYLTASKSAIYIAGVTALLGIIVALLILAIRRVP